jgi:hypothetical protein
VMSADEVIAALQAGARQEQPALACTKVAG